MAGFTLKFDAQTSGNYKIAYKDADDPCAVYQYKEVYVNNQSYPHEVSVNIDIEGSLYCDNITYTGWVLPMCFGEVYQPGQTVPDHATIFTHVIGSIANQCHRLYLHLAGYKIESFTIDNGGSGYDESDPPTLTIVRDAYDPLVPDDPLDPNPYDAVSIVPVISDGEIVGVNFTSASMNRGGAYNPQHLNDPTMDPTVTITGGIGTGAVITPVLANSGDTITTENIDEIACSDVTNTMSITLTTPDDKFQMCGNQTTARSLIPIHYNVDDLGCCYCEQCGEATIDATAATSGSMFYCYNKCWDESSVTMFFAEIKHGETVVLSNAIKETYNVLSSTLDVPAQTTWII